ncbi:MAG: hypothetical protein CVV64_20260 [Candidatus Wallbacteria bacterium HGW-Wallbacteria-1]|jgi:transporter family protein|uniref:EamA domain-containing protein n=1 Tax=Candidatus Wallbacteria bacterium HGW-Wallbacteria-1 TaxID=2013854 RepID=A0A2N1PID6_9BACT|nr:MAG: hypothetical protein CVV64_20260 [Candidatus Wallbacteria bacterium HGW-Wallbacteria-1]
MDAGGKDWLFYSVMATIVWGFWGFLPKLSTARLDPRSALVYGVCGSIFVGLWVAIQHGKLLTFEPLGFTFAFLTGLCGSVGGLFFLHAIKKGPVSLVICLTALYPAISVLLAMLIIKEPVSARQWIGIVMAICSMMLVSL